jgi:excisionase family DNA binding protein
MKALISIAEFQGVFGVSRSTVYRLEERGEIEFLKIGRAVRIRREDAENWCRGLSTASRASASGRGNA